MIRRVLCTIYHCLVLCYSLLLQSYVLLVLTFPKTPQICPTSGRTYQQARQCSIQHTYNIHHSYTYNIHLLCLLYLFYGLCNQCYTIGYMYNLCTIYMYNVSHQFQLHNDIYYEVKHKGLVLTFLLPLLTLINLLQVLFLVFSLF